MLPDRKVSLDPVQREEYDIPKNTQAYAFFIDKVIEERCDEFDSNLEADGFIIVYQDYEPAAASIFNYTVYAYKAI